MSTMNIIHRRLYQSQPPALQTKADMNPSLLVSWWCTGFSLVAILIRVAGRYVRTEMLFREDKIMFYSIIPLLIRMALVHVILIWGTNNTETQGLTSLDIQHREIGSKLVLASRIVFAIYIWMAKFTVCEFLKHIVGAYWRKSYEVGLQGVRYFLLVTLIAVVIATLTECQPFGHYWQVVPDPGPKCREGLAQLITMGVCDMITDILLVIYPIPIVIMSAMPVSRKLSLTMLFALSLGMVAVTAYRVPSTISRKSAQQYRSLLASLEILGATAVSNAIVIGSFIRDRGAKKQKFRQASVAGESNLSRVPTRRATITQNQWGSDSDLVGDLGMSLHPTLQSRANSIAMQQSAAPAMPTLPPSAPSAEGEDKHSLMDVNWNFGKKKQEGAGSDNDSTTTTTSSDLKLEQVGTARSAEPISPGAEDPTSQKKNVSFFDVGDLMQQPQHQSPSSGSGGFEDSRSSSTQDFAAMLSTQPRKSPPVSRKSSRAFLSDVGGLLSSHREEEDMDRSTALPPAARRPSQPEPSVMRNFSRRGSAYTGTTSRIPENEGLQAPPYRPGRDVSGPTTTSGRGSGAAGASSLDFSDAGGLLR